MRASGHVLLLLIGALGVVLALEFRGGLTAVFVVVLMAWAMWSWDRWKHVDKERWDRYRAGQAWYRTEGWTCGQLLWNFVRFMFVGGLLAAFHWALERSVNGP